MKMNNHSQTSYLICRFRGHIGHINCQPSTAPQGHGATVRIGQAALLNFIFALLEFIGGFYAQSIALMSDALHDLGDSLSLFLGLILEKLSLRQANFTYTYGYRRLSLLSALLSAVVILVSAVFIILAAIDRWLVPRPVQASWVIGFAILGIVVNGSAFLRLSKGASLNERVLKYHLLEDFLGWVVVLVGAIVMYWTQLYWVDPLMAILISLWIFFRMGKYFKQTLDIFLQTWPSELPRETIRSELLQIPGVRDVHHLHGWSLDGQSHVLTFHLVLEADITLTQATVKKNEIKQFLRDKWQISDLTIEIENLDSCPDIQHNPS